MSSSHFRLVTLGRMALVAPTGEEDASLGTRRRKLALLALLALARRPLSRDLLVEMFWGDQAEERARHSLSDALSHLRRALGAGSITTRRAEVALDPATPLAVDVLELAAAADARRWGDVVALYAGPFLDGVHVAGSPRWEQWVDQQRRQIDAAFESACRAECLRLAAEGERGDEGAWSDCAELAQRWLDRAPLSGDAGRHLVVALAADGTRDAAVRSLDEHDRLVRHLRAEYGAAPDPAVTEAAQVVAARLATIPAAIVPDRGEDAAPGSVPNAATGPAPSEPQPGSRARSAFGRRALVVGAVAATLLIAAAVIVATGRPWRGADLQAAAPGLSGRVLVADLQSSGADYAYALLVGEALRIGLAATPSLRVVDAGAVGSALVRVQRPSTTPVDALVARELARNERLAAIVVGSVRVGPNGVALAASIESPTGTVLARADAVAADTTQLIAAADTLVRQLRRGIGDGANDAATSSLAAVATTSPRALERYTQAARAERDGGMGDRAVALLEEAVALDTTFALAYRRLGLLLDENPYTRARMVDALTRAERHADRLPPRDRLHTAGVYHMLVTGDYGRAAALYREMLALQPDDGGSWHNLGMIYQYIGDERRGADAYARAIAIDPRSASTWSNLIDARYASGDSAGAWRAIEEMSRTLPGHRVLFSQTAALAAADGDFARAEQELSSSIAANPNSPRSMAIDYALLSSVYWAAGRTDDGDAARREAIRLDRRRRAHETALQGELVLAAAAAWLRHDPGETRRRVVAALAATPIDRLPPLDRPYLDLATAWALGGDPARARATLATYERLTPEPVRRQNAGAWHQALGSVALAERRYDDAIAEFRRVAGPLCTVCGLGELAVAYDAVGRADSARAVSARFLRTRTLRRVDMTDGFHRRRALERVGTERALASRSTAPSS